jgi:hypothetical protein
MKHYSSTVRSLVPLCLAVLSGFTSSCGAPLEAEEVGLLELALTAQTPQGKTFGLQGTFRLNDPESLTATSTATDGATSLMLAPRVGSYQLTLCDGTAATQTVCGAGVVPWRLFELACSPTQAGCMPPAGGGGGSGTPTPRTDAVLSSVNPQPVTIAANQTATAAFQFVVPGTGPITFARGNLNINVAVQEGLANGATCTSAIQCQSQICMTPVGGGAALTCRAPACNDGVKNGTETGADCGGSCAAVCPTTPSPTACTVGGAAMCPAGQTCGPNGTCQTTTSPTACTVGGAAMCPAGQTCRANGTCG